MCAPTCAARISRRETCSRSATCSSTCARAEVERAGGEVSLTAREFELLAYLMRHPGQVLSREQILNAVWGFDYEPGTNVLEVYVSYLRNKLRCNGSDAPIETVRGAGYRLLDSSD